jgi:hypothetical protein
MYALTEHILGAVAVHVVTTYFSRLRAQNCLQTLNHSPVKFGRQIERYVTLTAILFRKFAIRYACNVERDWNRNKPPFEPHSKQHLNTKSNGSHQVVFKPEADAARSGGTIVCRDSFSFCKSIPQRQRLSLLSYIRSFLILFFIPPFHRSFPYLPFFSGCHLRCASKCLCFPLKTKIII